MAGRRISISEGIEAMLRADAQVQRRYRNASGEIIWLYVGYYGTKRGEPSPARRLGPLRRRAGIVSSSNAPIATGTGMTGRP